VEVVKITRKKYGEINNEKTKKNELQKIKENVFTHSGENTQKKLFKRITPNERRYPTIKKRSNYAMLSPNNRL
jgi:hypothetical protein